MQKDSYNQLSEKIEKLNFHAYKERIEIQRNLEAVATKSAGALTLNGNLLKVIITLQILNLSKDFPAVIHLFKLIGLM